MDDRLVEISQAVQNINRNLTLLVGGVISKELNDSVQTAVEGINQFEAITMHRVRKAMENT